MSFFNQAENIPLAESADVAVIGGGPSGFCASIAAARSGVSVLLVDEGGCAGGMATKGLVGPFMTCYDRDSEQMIIKGLFEELVDRLVASDGAIHPSGVHGGTAFTSWIQVGHDHVTPFDPEVLKRVMDEMLVEAGVRVMYHTSFVEPLLQDNTLKEVVISSKSGLRRISAKVFIDCTGDGDVACRCGVPCRKGNEELGIVQPASMFFRIGNVDLAAVEADIEKNKDNFYRKDGVNYRSFHWHVSEARERGDWNLKRVSIGLFRGVKEDEWFVNTSRIMDIDATDSKSLTYGEITGRQQVHVIFEFLKKYVPGCENAKLLSSASTLGIRESRHVQGEYTLDVDDVLEGRVPEDSILLAANSIDVHGRFGPLSNQYLTVSGGRWYGVPFRCLLPQRIDQLLIAGRCISATADAAGAIRVMPPCMGTGQAAGIAAAMAARSGGRVRDVAVKDLQKKLIEQGAFLDR